MIQVEGMIHSPVCGLQVGVAVESRQNGAVPEQMGAEVGDGVTLACGATEAVGVGVGNVSERKAILSERRSFVELRSYGQKGESKKERKKNRERER